MPTTRTLSPALPPAPPTVNALPLDNRGFPVPFLISFKAGIANFADAADPKKWTLAYRMSLCSLCGQKLPREKFFLLDPAEAVSHRVDQLPKHEACAKWEMLAIPHYRNELDGADQQFKIIARCPGFSIVGTVPPRIRPGHFDKLTFWIGGQAASRECVEFHLAEAAPLVVEYFGLMEPGPGRLLPHQIQENVAEVKRFLPAAKENPKLSGA